MSASVIFEIILAIIPFAIELYHQFVGQAAEAKAKNEAFKIDSDSWKKANAATLDITLTKVAKETQGAKDAWDQADESKKS